MSATAPSLETVKLFSTTGTAIAAGTTKARNLDRCIFERSCNKFDFESIDYFEDVEDSEDVWRNEVHEDLLYRKLHPSWLDLPNMVIQSNTKGHQLILVIILVSTIWNAKLTFFLISEFFDFGSDKRLTYLVKAIYRLLMY